MPFSLKILVHEIKIVVSEVLLIEEPILSVTFANYPKIFIKGRSKLSSTSYEKVFSHGKSALLQVDQERLEEILKEQPLELMLLNGTKILAGGRINLDQFLHTINLEFRFKRGNFHLLDHFGKPYALADISLSIHNVNLEPPEVPTIKQLMNGQIEPPPDEIVYKKKNQKPPIDKKSVETPAHPINQDERNDKSNNERTSQKLQTKPIPKVNQYTNDNNNNNNNNNIINTNNNNNNNNIAQNSTSQQKLKQQKQVIKQIYQTKPKAKSKYAQQTPKPKSPLKTKNNTKQRPQSAMIQAKASKLQAVYVKKPENLQDIPIEVWANGNHCPPPMILDKKIYVHQVFNAPEERLPIYVKEHQTNSIAIQTDYIIPQATTQVQQSQSQHRQITQQSDGYQDDFESVSQSHSQLIVNKSPKTGPRIIQNTKSIKEADEVSDIYEDDFEQMSQSLKRSQSLKSYIPDFESISQSRR